MICTDKTLLWIAIAGSRPALRAAWAHPLCRLEGSRLPMNQSKKFWLGVTLAILGLVVLIGWVIPLLIAAVPQ